MGSVMAGQVSAMVNGVQPAREIIADVVAGAENVIGSICNGKVNVDR